MLLRLFAHPITCSRSRTRGQGLVEYVFLLVLLATVVVGALTPFSHGLGEDMFTVTCAMNRSSVWYSLDGVVWYERDDQGKAMMLSCLEDDSSGVYRLIWDRAGMRTVSLPMGVGTMLADTSLP